MKLIATLTASAYGSAVTFVAFKEQGLDRHAAQADCIAKEYDGLANIYSAAEQTAVNTAINDVGGATPGDERAFWLGMQETSTVAIDVTNQNQLTEIRDATIDIDGVVVGFNGWDDGLIDEETGEYVRGRKPQPSNQLDFGNDKHTTGESSFCVRQLGINGWNDAMCSRTWSGARKKGIQMGHVCEKRTVEHPIQATGEFEETFVAWLDAFLNPAAAGRWQSRVETFASRIRTNILNRPCVTDLGDPSYGGITEVDENGDALGQLDTIADDMKSFFTTYMSGCGENNKGKTAVESKSERLDDWVEKLNEHHDDGKAFKN